jgi:hypothetical protein
VSKETTATMVPCMPGDAPSKFQFPKTAADADRMAKDTKPTVTRGSEAACIFLDKFIAAILISISQKSKPLDISLI